MSHRKTKQLLFPPFDFCCRKVQGRCLSSGLTLTVGYAVPEVTTVAVPMIVLSEVSWYQEPSMPPDMWKAGTLH